MSDDIILNGHFFNPTCGNLTLDGSVKEIFKYIAEDKEKFYDIIIGCDSSSEEEPHFPLAIVVLRKGEGGRFFLKRIKYPEGRKFYGWKQRILNEVLLSCQLALTLKEKIAQAWGRTRRAARSRCSRCRPRWRWPAGRGRPGSVHRSARTPGCPHAASD